MGVTKSLLFRNYEYPDSNEIIFIELPKLRKLTKEKNVDLNDLAVQWLIYIDWKNKEGIKQVMKMNKEIRNADKFVKTLTGSEKRRRIAQLRKKSELDYISFMEYSKEIGEKRGIEQK